MHHDRIIRVTVWIVTEYISSLGYHSFIFGYLISYSFYCSSKISYSFIRYNRLIFFKLKDTFNLFMTFLPLFSLHKFRPTNFYFHHKFLTLIMNVLELFFFYFRLLILNSEFLHVVVVVNELVRITTSIS